MGCEPPHPKATGDGAAVADQRHGAAIDAQRRLPRIEARDLAVRGDPNGLVEPECQGRRIGKPRVSGGTYGTIHGSSIRLGDAGVRLLRLDNASDAPPLRTNLALSCRFQQWR